MAKSKQKQPEMKAFLACEIASKDDASGKVSLLSIFDLIWAEQFPGLFRPFCLYAKVASGSGKHEIHVEGTGADGKPFGAARKVKLKFNAAGTADLIIQIGLMPLAGPGVVTLKLFMDGKQVGWPCEIQVKKGKSPQS